MMEIDVMDDEFLHVEMQVIGVGAIGEKRTKILPKNDFDHIHFSYVSDNSAELDETKADIVISVCSISDDDMKLAAEITSKLKREDNFTIGLVIGDDDSVNNSVKGGIIEDDTKKVYEDAFDVYHVFTDESEVKVQMVVDLLNRAFNDKILIGLDYKDVRSILKDAGDMQIGFCTGKGTDEAFKGMCQELEIENDSGAIIMFSGNVSLYDATVCTDDLIKRMKKGSNMIFALDNTALESGSDDVMAMAIMVGKKN